MYVDMQASGRPAPLYHLFRKLQDGEYLHIGSREALEDTQKLLEAFNSEWPGDYIIKDAEGNELNLPE